MIDSRAVLDQIVERRQSWEEDRLAETQIDLFDGLMRHRAPVYGHISEEFEWVENDTGVASIKLPKDHYLLPWILNHKGRDKKDIHIRFRRQGAQWDGAMVKYTLTRDTDGEIVLELVFQHCYEELKHILVWANPFTPAEVQFPKVWAIIGQFRWTAALTLWANVFRLESAIWSIPGDPFDPDQWPQLSMSNWSIVVVPVDIASDNSTIGILWSRFKPFHEVVAKAAKAAQISIHCRRYYTGDPIPEGLGFTPRHGALVVSFEDNSGWRTETSFFGSMLTGLERAVIQIGEDGLTENISTVSGDPTFPEEYYEPGWRGTRPQAPWIVIEDGPESGILESEFEYYPATDFQHVAGGRSMPGVNEAISAAVIAVGNFIGSMIQLPGYGVGLSGLGSVIDAVAKPLYEDTLMAFQHWDAPMRETEFGPFGKKEKFAGGDQQAYTLGAFMAGRASIFTTRERTGHKISFLDNLPYRIGPNGYGDLWLGTRLAVRPPGLPRSWDLYVEQVTRLKHTLSSDGAREWEIEVGWKEPSDPLMALFDYVRDVGALASELGL